MEVKTENIAINNDESVIPPMPKTRLKPIVRKRINFLCSHCNKTFQSIANTRAKCPLCAASCSIKVSTEIPEKYEKMGESDNSLEKLEFEPAFVSEKSTIELNDSIIAKKISENEYELQNKKVLQLKTDNFKDLIELYNAGATIKGIKPISESELTETFSTINDFLRENKIFEGIGKTGVVDIVFKFTGLILDRLIPWLIMREQNKMKEKDEKFEKNT